MKWYHFLFIAMFILDFCWYLFLVLAAWLDHRDHQQRARARK